VNLSQAYAILRRLLDPLPLDQFLDEVLGKRAIRIGGGPDHFRSTLLGDAPEQAILADFARLAPAMTSHAEGATAPPPDKAEVAAADAFGAHVTDYHDRGYTVRLPTLRGSTPALDEVLRALECAFHQPAEDAAFWSRGGGRAPIHYDEYDILVVQLRGHKKWHISTEPSALHNRWKGIPGDPPTLGRHQTVEVGPGDLLYLPRGTHHAVEALTDSVHISIGFVPLTVREAIIAAIDHLSDLDIDLREIATSRLGEAVRTSKFDDIQRGATAGIQKLLQASAAPGFMAQALQRRSSRVFSDLTKLTPTKIVPPLALDTRLRHSPLAISHLSANAEKIDFSQPGEHIYIHRGAERSVAFIAETPEFRVRDLPSDVAEDVHLALVARFITSGFLEVVE
jgi:hypothetical protein